MGYNMTDPVYITKRSNQAWALLLSIPGWVNEGDYQWGNNNFWTNVDNMGAPSNNSHYDKIFKSQLFGKWSNFSKIMVEVYNDSGVVLGWGTYDLLSAHHGKSWYDLVSSGTRTIITGNRIAQGGDSNAGHNHPQSTIWGFSFTDTGKTGCAGEPMVVNDQQSRYNASNNRVRIGTAQYSDSPTNRCHIVSGGFGVEHSCGGWSGGQAVGPHLDYCTNSGAGQGYRAWGVGGNTESNNTYNYAGASNWAHASNCFTDANNRFVRYGARIFIR